MGSGSCSTCRFWDRDAEIAAITSKPVRVQGICGGIASEWDWRLDDGDPGAEVAMLVDANAMLITGPGFGCVLWEEARGA